MCEQGEDGGVCLFSVKLLIEIGSAHTNFERVIDKNMKRPVIAPP